ncbi:MAG: hypothetical protein SFT93_00815 [Rickettsiaceae bacterium]|nr:hypothetical protein [Rickettsiaceae bacterium]
MPENNNSNPTTPPIGNVRTPENPQLARPLIRNARNLENLQQVASLSFPSLEGLLPEANYATPLQRELQNNGSSLLTPNLGVEEENPNVSRNLFGDFGGTPEARLLLTQEAPVIVRGVESESRQNENYQNDTVFSETNVNLLSAFEAEAEAWDFNLTKRKLSDDFQDDSSDTDQSSDDEMSIQGGYQDGQSDFS